MEEKLKENVNYDLDRIKKQQEECEKKEIYRFLIIINYHTQGCIIDNIKKLKFPFGYMSETHELYINQLNESIKKFLEKMEIDITLVDDVEVYYDIRNPDAPSNNPDEAIKNKLWTLHVYKDNFIIFDERLDNGI